MAKLSVLWTGSKLVISSYRYIIRGDDIYGQFAMLDQLHVDPR